ncbi:MAG: glutamine amidotransferase [Spirochaetota bacterium]
MARILVVGEQWTSATTEVKGPIAYSIGAYKEDGTALVEALRSRGYEVDRFVTCRVPEYFPEDITQLRGYDVICLSDIGADAFLFHPEMLTKSIRHPNRLSMLRDYVSGGGGLVMIGGWMSFSGIDGKARYHGTAVEEVLPVTCLTFDDRQECPEGIVPEAIQPSHPIMKGLPSPWPFFLGYNRVVAKPGSSVIMKAGDDPFLSAWTCGKGRAAAFASDCAPHWGSSDFLKWEGYAAFWGNLAGWLAGA